MGAVMGYEGSERNFNSRAGKPWEEAITYHEKLHWQDFTAVV